MATHQVTRTAPTHAARRPRRAGADPIFAAIAAMERATRKYMAAEAEATLSAKHDKAADAALRDKCDAAFAVVDLTPTTPAGAIAQLRVLASLLNIVDDTPTDAVAMAASGTIRRAVALIQADTLT